MLLMSDVRVGWLIFAVAVLIRIPTIVIPPADGLYNVDEQTLALSVVDRWLGLPPIYLVWPAMLPRFVGMVMFAPQFLWALVSDRSLDKFTQVVFAYYEDPSAIIIALRSFSAVAGAAAAVAGYQLARHLSGNWRAGVLAAVAITLAPLPLEYSLTAKGDAIGFALTIWAMRFALCEPVKPVLVGLLTAAAFANRVVSVAWLLPVLLAAAVLIWSAAGPRRLLGDILRSAGAGLVGLPLFYPYLWLEPVRALKAVSGTIMLQGDGSVPLFDLLSMTMSGSAVMGVLIAAAVLGGVGSLRNARYRIAGAALSVSLAILLLWLLLHGFGYWRYLFGALIPFIVLFAMTLAPTGRGVTLPVLTAVTVVFAAIGVYQEIGRRTGPSYRETARAITTFCQRGDTVWLEDGVLSGTPDRIPLPTSALREIVSYLERADTPGAIADWLKKVGVPRRAALALQTNFDESDQIFLARWRLRAAYSESPLNCPFHLFRTLTDAPNGSSGGFVRGTFTDKTRADMSAVLRNPPAEGAVRVIGKRQTLAPLGLPMQDINRLHVLITVRAADAR